MHIGISSGTFFLNGRPYCENAMSHITGVSLYIINKVLGDFAAGINRYKSGQEGMMKNLSSSTLQFIVWLKKSTHRNCHFGLQRTHIAIKIS